MSQYNEKPSSLTAKLIPVLIDKYPTFWALAEAGENIERIVYMLIMSAYLIRGDYSDYKDAVSSQRKDDKLSYKTFLTLSHYFSIFSVKPELVTLFEIYTVILSFSETEAAMELIERLPEEEKVHKNDSKFWRALILLQNGLVPEVKDISLLQLDILRNSLRYVIEAEQVEKTPVYIPFSLDYTDTEQLIACLNVICDLASLVWAPQTGGTLLLTESLTRELLLLISNRNNRVTAGQLFKLSH